MLKSRLILVVVCVISIIVLFLLPRVVVENDQPLATGETDSLTGNGDMHAAVPQAIRERIKNFRAVFSSDSRNEKNAIFADSLASLYAVAGQYDSSAWFAEEAAKFFNETESWLKAGDAYYQAYNFALDAGRQAMFAGKARAFYSKVLERNPREFDVRTKLAMTYLSDENPMQAITMLREVIAEDPDNKLALYNMGMLSIQSGQYERAVERLERLTELDSDNPQAHLLLGIAYMNSGKRSKAKEQFEKVKLLDNDPAVQATADSYLKDLK